MLGKVARSFIGTSFDVDSFEEWFNSLDEEEEDVRYVVYQVEVCPETKREHCQWYIELKKTARFSYIKKMLDDNKAHVENRKGSRSQARRYCSKEESRERGPYEWGIWIPKDKVGVSADYLECREKIKKGEFKDWEEVEEVYPIVCLHYSKMIEKLLNKKLRKETRKFRHVKVYVLWGASGCGKTSYVFNKYKYNLDILSATSDGKCPQFINGYRGLDVLLIDEFRGWLGFDFFLGVTDSYPITLNIKNGHSYSAWKEVWITSNVNPRLWFLKQNIFGDALEPLLRRLNTGGVRRWNVKDKCLTNINIT